MSKRDPVIVAAVRTPIGKQGGAMASLKAHEFGAIVIKEVLKRAKIKAEDVDDVIFGNVLSGGGNIARLSALQTGLSLSIPGVTVDRQCGSSINTVNLAAQAIKAGDCDIVVAGGTESMSRAPFLLEKTTKAYATAPPKILPAQLSPKEIGDPPMGITAENLANEYSITREEQDKYALCSQQKMANAMKQGFFTEQIVPISIPVRKGKPIVFHEDEHPRPNTSLEALAKLPPAFIEGGSVTAGSSSGLNDAASALVLMSREKAEELGVKPLAAVIGYTVTGVDPNKMGIGPVPAIRALVEKTKVSLEEVDFVELNEAFAAQVLACNKELGIPDEKLNVNGGAIAHGHPLGATGGILVAKAVYELKRRQGKYAVVSACIGGGQGIATLLKREED
ncbi:thiolase family protein [Alkalihalobacillus sp. LMS39]|uniref:thiolase family protein n=1 Tax=Alkalihalobacillus sp. LMS39 TaxID=2924032 RepID=UPI001FB4A3C8|nr:thiolase family protein [Alkalihalobacillus sp. LMS39]UOE95650.1 thiolase family protein [Alkalihalobacillus sp. LMS39]